MKNYDSPILTILNLPLKNETLNWGVEFLQNIQTNVIRHSSFFLPHDAKQNVI